MTDLHEQVAGWLTQVAAWLTTVDLSGVPGWQVGAATDVRLLAQGEYNRNLILRQADRAWVLRINMGTQIDRDDQILYEFRALQLLSTSGVTPQAYVVDDSRGTIPHGVLLMEYLPGEPLDYRRDVHAAGALFARVHSVPGGPAHLIVEDRPLSQTFDECSRLLPVYLDSDLADPDIAACLRDVLAWAHDARHDEDYFVRDPQPCVINTEVNSGNFIADRDAGTLRLVDWEKPLWGDPSQDLSHFAVPTTTLWKSDVLLGPGDRRRLLDAWRAGIANAHLRDTIGDRVALRDPFNCLRGISWSAMAWVNYQTGDHALRNGDTFRKVSEYLDLDFIRGLFQSQLQGGS